MFPNVNRVGLVFTSMGSTGSFVEIPLPGDFFDIVTEDDQNIITEMTNDNIVMEGA